MIDDLTIADSLDKEGRLDKKLKRRLWFFEMLCFLFGLITFYDIVFEGFHWFHVFLVVAVSFLFGFLVLRNVHKVFWDKKKKIVMAGKMDIFGVLLMAGYIGARILSDVYLRDFFDGNITKVLAYTFFIIFGVTLGRFVGVLLSISDAIPKFHKKRLLRISFKKKN
jgi:hypothetical protein